MGFRTRQAPVWVAALCIAAAAVFTLGCVRQTGGADRGAERQCIDAGQIKKMYFTCGKSRLPLTSKKVVDKDTMWETDCYDSLVLHVETKRGNDGKTLKIKLYDDDDDGIRYDVFGTISGNKIAFGPFKGYPSRKPEPTRSAAAEIAGAPAETTAVTVPAPYGKLTDARDGKEYRTMETGGRTWMAENLNHKPAAGNSWCYDDSDSGCAQYGRLYDWETAMVACPAGWHLPTDEEWDSLGVSAGGTLRVDSADGDEFRFWAGAGKELRATDWYQLRHQKNKQFRGFSALPGGCRCLKQFKFSDDIGYWWSATERDADGAYFRSIYKFRQSDLEEGYFRKSAGYSVRCVMDDARDASRAARKTYWLRVSADTGGIASAESRRRKYDAGDTVTISAVPSCGYVFVKWTGGDFANADSATTNVTVNANAAIVAKFKRVLPPVVHGEFTDSRDGKTYRTVQICKYVWMAENLNYKTQGGSLCIHYDSANCAKYGRLYSWEKAMTACPPGWHLSLHEEWKELAGFARGWDVGEDGSGFEGKWLKAKSVWDYTPLSPFGSPRDENTVTGMDAYGFSALPGGSHNHVDNHYYSTAAGSFGGWWVAVPQDRGAGRRVGPAFWSMSNHEDGMRVWNPHLNNPDCGHSVRCVSDEYRDVPAPDSVLLTVTAGPGGSVAGNPGKTRCLAGEGVAITAVPDRGYRFSRWTGGPVENAGYATTFAVVYSDTTVTATFKEREIPPPVYGTLIDSRDGKTYKTVNIGKKTWMAENLNYETPGGSWCYEDSNSYCDKYGRLYNWKTAKKACPAGWRLPSREEWNRLSQEAGGVREKRYNHWLCLFPLFAKNYYWVWSVAGKTLKSTSGWKKQGNGTDDYGFSALPGGYRRSDYFYNSNGFRFTDAGYYGYWWKSTGRRLISMIGGDDLRDDYIGDKKEEAYSVRCVENGK